MQVSSFTLIAMIIGAFVAIVTPITAYLHYHRQQQLSFHPLLAGLITWVVITQFLEKGIHFLIIVTTPITHFPLLFSLYAALITGIFEETGRFLVFKKFLPHNRQWQDGVGYGIGHGGIESIIIGGITGLQLTAFALFINLGHIATLKKLLPHSLFIHTVNTIYSVPSIFLIGGIERIFVFALQIGFSILCLLAVREKRLSLLFLAILLHTLSNFPAALYQIGQLNLWLTETLVIICGIGSIIWIKKSKKLFS